MAWIWNAGGNDGFGDVRNLVKVDGHRHGVLFFPLKALLVAMGWTVEGSGDGNVLVEFRGSTGGAGTGSGGAYDVWTADTGAHDASPGNVSNALAWCVLQSPSGKQILLVGTGQTVAGFDAYGTIEVSPGKKYAAAGIGASNPPAVTSDSRLLRGDRAVGAELVDAAGAGRIHIGAQSQETRGIWPFFYVAVTNPGALVHDMLIRCPISSNRSWVLSPQVYVQGADGLEMTKKESPGLGAERWITAADWIAAFAFDAGFWNDGAFDDPSTGDLPVGQVAIASQVGVPNEEYFEGVIDVPFVRAAVQDGAAVAADYPKLTQQDANGITWLHVGKVLVPWDDTMTQPIPDGGTPGTTAAEFIVQGEGAQKNLVPPVISALSPPAGTDIEPDQVVSFEVTDDVGSFARIFVVAKDLDSGIAEVVHDGDAFNGFFVEQSTRVLIAGGIRYELLRRDGWTGTRLEISAFAIDEDGNEGTL